MTSKRYPERRHALLATCLTVWTAAIIATHIPPGRVPHMGVSDKLLHVLGYFVLASVFWMTLKGYRVNRLMRITCVLMGMLAYAAFDELTQPIFNRDANILDWLADVIGTVISVIGLETVLFIIQKWRASSPATRAE